jgi:4-aminobutyrate aminotransferase
MIGVEFASPSPISAHDPNVRAGSPKSLASRVAKRCLEKGMLILTTSIYEVVRFIPPLNVSAEDMARGIEIFTQAVEEVVKEG